MKLKITSLILVFIAAVTMAFVPPVTKSALKVITYKADPAKSSLTWMGRKLTGSHNGTITLQSGNLDFDGKKLTGGKFVIDMTSIKDADGSDRLENHLKADDFFGVDKFATAAFVIRKVTDAGTNTVNVTGDLTIKGITNPVTFPAKITWNADGSVTAVADKIIVDRTKYGIKYRSKGIFPDVGDKMIYDDFELSVKLAAGKS